MYTAVLNSLHGKSRTTRELAPADGTLQLAAPAFSPYPQLKDLVLVVDSVPGHAVTRPLQDEFVVARQLLNLTQKPKRPGCYNSANLVFLVRSEGSIRVNRHYGRR